MLKFVIFAVLAISCHAQYGGLKSPAMATKGYAAPSAFKGFKAAEGFQASSYAPAPEYALRHDAAIQTRRTYQVIPVAYSQELAQPQIIEVAPGDLPVQVLFRTQSSRLNVQQTHTPSIPPQPELASFQEQPHKLVHEVLKPVIQEVREIIQPYRRITQEIRPVIEEVHSVVHKGEGKRLAVPLPVALPTPLPTPLPAPLPAKAPEPIAQMQMQTPYKGAA